MTEDRFTPEQIARPEKIQDERLGSILSAVGNNEVKCILLLGMQEGIIYTSGDLNRRMRGVQGTNPGWRQHHNGPFQYCQESFAPIGLVVREVIDPIGTTFGYIKTEEGRKVTALLGGLLNFSLNHPEVSLIDLLASTNSSAMSNETEDKVRAPLTRLKIFFELATSGELPIQVADLSRAIGEDQAQVGKHILALSGRVISYESAGKGKPYSLYHLSDEHPESEPNTFKHYSTLTKRVYRAILSNPSEDWTKDKVVEFLIQNYPEDSSTLTRFRNKNKISDVLFYLRNLGYLTLQEFSREERSKVTLTDAQRDIILDFLTVIDQFQDQNPEALITGERLAMEIIHNPQHVSTLMAKARLHSGHANKLSHVEWYRNIVSVLEEHPNITSRDIAVYLQEIVEHRFDFRTIAARIGELKKKRGIRVESINGIDYYSTGTA